jgi:Arc/MetJ-type ribon-helix-helix transcriptional regulator
MVMTLRIDRRLERKLSAMAKKRRMTRSELGRVALLRLLEDEEFDGAAFAAQIRSELEGIPGSGRRDLSACDRNELRKRIAARAGLRR